MKWSLSEFLNLLELRGQCWCQIDLRSSGGFSVPHNDAILFYAVLEGCMTLVGATSQVLELNPGDIAMVLSGDGHSVHCQPGGDAPVLQFLQAGEYVDEPPAITLGRGPLTASALCGRLKVRWPGGRRPPDIPTILKLKSDGALLNLQTLKAAAVGEGAAAVLTHAAMLLFTVSFRQLPECESIFHYSTLHDSISRALQLIQKHPFQDWTVDRLARKVQMGHSNFAARFAAEIGKTPIEVLVEERMKLAARFLQQTDQKILEISDRIGYRSQAAFSRRFASYYGMSPGRMRRLWRQGSAGTSSV